MVKIEGIPSIIWEGKVGCGGWKKIRKPLRRRTCFLIPWSLLANFPDFPNFSSSVFLTFHLCLPVLSILLSFSFHSCQGSWGNCSVCLAAGARDLPPGSLWLCPMGPSEQSTFNLGMSLPCGCVMSGTCPSHDFWRERKAAWTAYRVVSQRLPVRALVIRLLGINYAVSTYLRVTGKV